MNFPLIVYLPLARDRRESRMVIPTLEDLLAGRVVVERASRDALGEAAWERQHDDPFIEIGVEPSSVGRLLLALLGYQKYGARVDVGTLRGKPITIVRLSEYTPVAAEMLSHDRPCTSIHSVGSHRGSPCETCGIVTLTRREAESPA